MTGTIGFLVAAVRRDLGDAGAADEILERMLRRGYRSPLRSVRALVE